MTLLQRLRYLWVRAGLLVLLASPVAMYLAFRAQGLPPDTLASTETLRVTESDTYVRFQPTSSAASTGWILIPGCPADPLAYAPLARAVAMRGVISVIVKVPYRCAPWPPHQDTLRQRVSGILDSCAECRWTLAGHSRGARHALDVVQALAPGRISALVLMGTTHPRDTSFADLKIPVMKISATEDGVAPLDASLANRALLPPHTRWETIDGGNHAQFGYYGYQLWDRPATISREEQHQLTAAFIVSVAGTGK